MSEIEMLIDDIIVRLKERGYIFKPEYTLNRSGEMISVKLVFVERIA